MNEGMEYCGERFDILNMTCNCQSCIKKREIDKKIRKERALWLIKI